MKKGLLRLDSDHDFYEAFGIETSENKPEDVHQTIPENQSPQLDRRGVRIIELDGVSSPVAMADEEAEDFESLLKASFESSLPMSEKTSKPVPLKKRLKRYPAVELELDLHGYTAIEAQSRARTFIQNCKQQGYFTVRIIVGKGRHSKMGPVLPDVIEDLVRQFRKEGLVLSFEWDRKVKSRSGSLIIYLKQFDQYD